ncbi:MAG: ATP-binding cassette domain-containing protein [Planctomycetes bacterium]|nr:ATP-binding cassette domain-containing protein [Planctomycetota bacterium]
MISVAQLTKAYGDVLAIQDLDFEIEGNTVVGFLGANGAGKSTTMKILACFLPPTRGTARVGGFDCFGESVKVREVLGYLPESVPLYPDMRVHEYLEYMAVLKGVPAHRRAVATAEVMARCHVDERRRSTIATLSKGLRQRVGLAATLIHNPRVLILDEPTIGLDPVEIRKTREMIRELATDHTVLLSTHILSEVEQICSRAIIIRRGSIIADADLSTLVRDQGRTIIDVAAHAPPGALAVAFAGLEGTSVEPLEPVDSEDRCRVSAPGEADLRAEISRLLKKNDWLCLGLEVRRETLEDVYVRITQTEKVL